MSREADIAWAAGLFEGEGCMAARAKCAAELMLGMTDLDVVQRFHQVVGVGYVYIEHRAHRNHKALHRWTCGRAADVRAILTAFMPYFGDRRASRATEILARIADNPGSRRDRTHCIRGHEFTPENTYVSTRNGRTSRTCNECRRQRARNARLKETAHAAPRP